MAFYSHSQTLEELWFSMNFAFGFIWVCSASLENSRAAFTPFQSELIFVLLGLDIFLTLSGNWILPIEVFSFKSCLSQISTFPSAMMTTNHTRDQRPHKA